MVVVHEPLEMPHPKLCDNCQFVTEPVSRIRYKADMKAMLLEDLQQQTCVLCQLVATSMSQNKHKLDLDVGNFSKTEVSIGPMVPIVYEDPYGSISLSPETPGPSPSASQATVLDCVVFLGLGHPVAPRASEMTERSLGIQISYDAGDQVSRVEISNTSFFDINLVSSWIHKCEQSHGDTCWSFPITVAGGFRLIDVDKQCITPITDPVRYVALSYVWGAKDQHDLQLTRTNEEQLSREGGVDPQTLPEVIADAITLCTDLRERYLWVDRLCILQDDQDSKHTQILAMDEIYGKAAFTIVGATKSPDVVGLPGVRGRPRPDSLHNKTREVFVEQQCVKSNFLSVIRQSQWFTRGWTFQEGILSPRVLYVADHQVYFSCLQHLVEEEAGISEGRLPNRQRSPLPDNKASRMLNERLAQSKSGGPGIDYKLFVQEYTSRNLSFPTDVLNAFAGVGKMLARELKTPLLFGVPENNLPSALLWEARHNDRRQGVSSIPSWSWPSWTGPVKNRIDTLMPAGYHGIPVKIYVKNSKELRALPQMENWFQREVDFTEIDFIPREGSLWMPYESTSTNAWRACPHNPWTVLDHKKLSPESYAVAQRYPECLVFNTTFARVHLVKEDGDDASVQYGLYSESQRRVGDIWLSRILAQKELQSPKMFYVIVLCASFLRKKARESLNKDNPWDVPACIWKLCVMLVREHQKDPSMPSEKDAPSPDPYHIFDRVGVGAITMELWHLAQPTWTTVILT